MSMTRVSSHDVEIFYVMCDFCGQVNPKNVLASREEVEQLEIDHRARHCRECYKLDGHETWCERRNPDCVYGLPHVETPAVITCERCGATTTDVDLWDPEADTGRVFCDHCWPHRHEATVTS